MCASWRRCSRAIACDRYGARLDSIAFGPRGAIVGGMDTTKAPESSLARYDVFDPAVASALLARIDRLQPGSPRQWGRMDVAQMAAHCQWPLYLALGERTIPRGIVGFLFGGLAKRKLLAPGEFGRNMPTAPSFVVRDAREFERERATLRALLVRLTQGGPAVLSKDPHPFFGALTSAEWSALQAKHLDHHLRQFGV